MKKRSKPIVVGHRPLVTKKPLLGGLVHWMVSRSTGRSACGLDRGTAAGMTDNISLVTCMKCGRAVDRMLRMEKQEVEAKVRHDASVGLTKDELGPPAEKI